MAMVVTPSLFVSTTVPDAFSAATDIAVSRGSGEYQKVKLRHDAGCL
jgi:hypothetical protein